MRRFWPLGIWPLLGPAVVIFLVVLSGSSAMWGWPYQDWSATSSAFMLQLAVAGPIAAGASAYYASRIVGPGKIFTSRPGARPSIQVLRRHLTLLTTWFIGAFVAAFMPTLLQSILNADSGHLNVLVALTGVVGLAVFILLGYALGAALHSFISVPVAFVGSLAIVVLGTTATIVLSPVPAFPFAIGDVPGAFLLWVRLIVMALLATGCLVFASSAIEGSRRIPLVSILALVLVVGFVALVKVRPPDVRALDPHPPTVCDSGSHTRVCVHSGHQRQLKIVERAAKPILSAYGPPPFGQWQVYDAALAGSARKGDHILWVGVAPENSENGVVQSDLVGQLVPVDECANKYGFQLPTQVEQLYSYLSAWLQNDGHRPDEYHYPHFRTLNRLEMQAWLAEHRAQLIACTVNLKTLPR